MTVAQARRILDRYEKIATRADRTRDAALLAEVAAGNVLERQTAGYRQYNALPQHERAQFAWPTDYRSPAFHIPAGASWFLVTATRAAPTPQPTVLVFARESGAGSEARAGRETRAEGKKTAEGEGTAEGKEAGEGKEAAEGKEAGEGEEAGEGMETAGGKETGEGEGRAEGRRRANVAREGRTVTRWRLRVALPLQAAGPLPRIAKTRSRLATEVDATPGSGSPRPRPYDVQRAYEDLWQTGGTDEARLLAPNAVTKEARSTYRHRDDELGAEGARRHFVPVSPRHRDSYALRTADGGVLAVVPLAHEQRLRVTRPDYQITPSDEEAVYDPAPRSTVISTFHGQALAHLPRQGRPAVLSAKYALVDSR
ncbi:hypothetical protein ABZY93_04310 [Streptomyces smyrnaeus]|uniref:hypothetical protein n=1 Tax=Streptomyces smyrnaeus TaxID=1387713 RepID=UPI0033B21EEE